MAIEQKRVNIDGDEYLLTMFPADKGLKVAAQVMALLGTPSAAFLKGDTEKAMQNLVLNMGSSDFVALAKVLCATATKGSSELNFNMEFSGKYGKMIKLCTEIVQFNFEDVFMLLASKG